MTIIFADDYSAGVSRWKAVTGDTHAPTIVAAPGGRSGLAFKSTLPAGGNRCELEMPTPLHRGDKIYKREPMYYSSATAFNPSNWQLVNQFKDRGSMSTSPPVSISLRSGTLRVLSHQRTGGSPGPDIIKEFYTPGIGWHDWVWEILLDFRGVGYISCWLNGAKILDTYKPPNGTFYDDGGQSDTVLRTGLYRSASSTDSCTIHYGPVIVATTAAEAGLGTTTTPAPVASFNVVDPTPATPVTVGENVTLDGAPSTGSGLTYRWDVTD